MKEIYSTVLSLDDFDYELPQPEQIAQYPLANRSESRLLCYVRDKNSPNVGHVAHHRFHDIINYLTEKDLIVFNNTKVIPARLFGHKATGGQVEILLERMISTKQFLAHVRTSKALKPGAVVFLENRESDNDQDISLQKQPSPASSAGQAMAATLLSSESRRSSTGQQNHHNFLEMISRQGDLFLFQIPDNSENKDKTVMDYLEICGHIPLPPYIQRDDVLSDQTRYQTVYAEEPGAVAAPTAGLHFDTELLEKLTQKGVQQGFLTLHVGAGTFQPVRVSSIADHKMHEEYLEIDQALCDKIHETKKNGGRVIAVGTTVVRALETAARGPSKAQNTGACSIKPYSGETDIFIKPGYEFKVIDGMVTNFHWPRTTLLMLVSALIGREKLLELYQEAIDNGYRFFSYGDAMLLL